MLLIRGEKRCLAHTLILAAPRIRAVLSNVTVISVFMSSHLQDMLNVDTWGGYFVFLHPHALQNL